MAHSSDAEIVEGSVMGARGVGAEEGGDGDEGERENNEQ